VKNSAKNEKTTQGRKKNLNPKSEEENRPQKTPPKKKEETPNQRKKQNPNPNWAEGQLQISPRRGRSQKRPIPKKGTGACGNKVSLKLYLQSIGSAF